MIVKKEERKLIDEFMKYSDGFGNHLEWWLGKWYVLMSIVRKIESFKHVNGSAKYNVRIEGCTVEIIHKISSNYSWTETFIVVDADSKDIAVYKAVIEFIKYYNEYENTKN